MNKAFSTALWLTLGAMISCASHPSRAAAPPAGAQAPRTAIHWRDGCTQLAIESENDYRFERACAQALSSFTDWPEPEGPDGYCHDYKDGYDGPRASLLPAPKFLPFDRRGRFLIELDCGSGAYNTRKFYLLYDETRLPATLTRLRFPYRAFGSERDPHAAIPPLIMVDAIGTRAYDVKRRELIVLVKFRGMGDCGIFMRYRFEGDAPVIDEMRVKSPCDGRDRYQVFDSTTPSPGKWQRVAN